MISRVAGPKAEYGGATWTHALLTGSPALDAIPAGSCTVSTDQRGMDRPQATGCDMGAFEAVQHAHEHFGRLDVVVNNAGYGHFG